MSAARLDSLHDGRFEARVQSGLRDRLLPLLKSAPFGYGGFAVAPLPGGRGASVLVEVDGERYVVRGGRRGGLPGRFVASLYCGRHPRVFDELVTTEELRQRGAPVVEVCAAAVYWVAPLLYRSWLVTRWLPGVHTLWQWSQQARDSVERSAMFTAVGRAVRRLHDAGACHPDLNLDNILVRVVDSLPVVWLLDLDGVHLTSAPIDGQADRARLRRSARKLDPHGATLVDADFRALDLGYESPPAGGVPVAAREGGGSDSR